MYKLSDFTQYNNEINHQVGFIQCLKTKWDRIHRETNVFRYKIENLQERIVGNKYLLQLNPDRSTKRRSPEQIENICQPFDKDKFNFTKVSADEIILTFVSENTDLSEHFLIVNVSPISQYHSLLCPSMLKCLPQVVTAESLQLIIDILFLTKDRDLKIGFNSLCGLASVNHLHYHLFIERNVLPIEKAKCHHLKGPVFCLHDYLVPGFCFEITLATLNQCDDVFKLIQVLLNQSIAHNIFITWGQSLTGNINDEVVRVIIWPRKSSSGAKQLAAFNVAVCELSGWFPVYDVASYENLNTVDLETELRKWKYDNFEELCEIIKNLY